MGTLSQPKPRSLDTIATSLLPIRYRLSVTNALSDSQRIALESYIRFAQGYIQQNAPYVKNLEVEESLDYGDARHHLIITHTLDVSADVAMEYWVAVDNEIETRAKSLPEGTANVITDFLTTNVRWKMDG